MELLHRSSSALSGSLNLSTFKLQHPLSTTCDTTSDSRIDNTSSISLLRSHMLRDNPVKHGFLITNGLGSILQSTFSAYDADTSETPPPTVMQAG